MQYSYLPEGRLLNTRENLVACATTETLRRAGLSGTILEGVALLATPEHDLVVQCGSLAGRIPRRECAIGIADNTSKDIAILSRVGKPVCFTIIGWEGSPDRPTPILSRRLVQQQAKQHLMHLKPGTILPATVTHLEPFGAFVDAGCGICSMIGIQRISVSRIPHPGERFRCGQEVWVAVLGQDQTTDHLLVTHRELLGSWHQNASLFLPGMTVPGIVRGVHDYGAFVELTANLSGLAEYHIPPAPGERISVLIKSIDPQRTKLKLAIIDRLPPAPPAPLRYFLPEHGHMDHWRYSPPGCRKAGSETLFSVLPSPQ